MIIRSRASLHPRLTRGATSVSSFSDLYVSLILNATSIYIPIVQLRKPKGLITIDSEPVYMVIKVMSN